VQISNSVIQLIDNEEENRMAQLITTLGPKNADDLGLILPHEHVFVDLRTCDQPGYAQADSTEVITLMAPEIAQAQAMGVTAIVECSTVGVGRRADIDRAVSEATNLPLVVPTGVYREPWIPDWVHAAAESALTEWLMGELTGEIEQSGVQAAWIKLSAGDDGLTPTETKVLRAAAKAGVATNAVIGSHTIRGGVVREQLDIIEKAGYIPARFIWIHAQVEPDFELNLEMARRGAWIEYDGIGSEEKTENQDASDDFYIHRIQRMLEAGFGDRILLSHDRGWFDPAQPGGGVPKPYTYLTKTFLPKLQAAGVDQATIRQLTYTNPFHAFAR
jgi:phosphotriesterase-related protein